MTNIRNILLVLFSIMFTNFALAEENTIKNNGHTEHQAQKVAVPKPSLHYNPEDDKLADMLNYQLGAVQLKDPFEQSNRVFFQMNKFLDLILVRPVSDLYSIIVPKWGRDRVGDALSNLSEPLSFINNTLQGKIDHAMVNLFRFFINSTIGVFGLMDVASMSKDLQPKKANFDHVLHKACFTHGDYLIIPFIGPSTDREAIGKLVDSAIDPVNYAIGFKWAFAKTSANIVQFRTVHKKEIEDLEKLAIDEYVMLRSIYAQKVKENPNCKRLGK